MNLAFPKLNTENGIIICGPTASGKSAFAIQLAKACTGVIINADSCQLYSEVPIITASPSLNDKKAIPHYLYNYLSFNESFSVAKYLTEASKIINQVKKEGYIPIIVGGTGLYINALLYGISDIPEIDTNLRNNIREEFDIIGKEAFYERLCKLDPNNLITSGDSQRMLRAYEVLMQTGNPITYYQKNKTNGICSSAEVIMLNPERSFLYENCNQRFYSFIENSAIDEVSKIANQITNNSPKVLGLNELASYIQGVISLDEAISKAQIKTRQYAKRQVTWFRHQIKEKYAIDFSSNKELEMIVDKIAKF